MTPLIFTYQYNSANQRTRATLDETGEFWDFAYDSLGQVINGTKKLPSGTPIPGYDFNYTFDEIGNRISSKAPESSSGTSTYAPVNELNQYQTRSIPRRVDVMGTANPTATITTNIKGSFRIFRYFSLSCSPSFTMKGPKVACSLRNERENGVYHEINRENYRRGIPKVHSPGIKWSRIQTIALFPLPIFREESPYSATPG